MGNQIREARLRAKLSQAELARLAKVSPSNLCAIESGARNASPAMTKRLLDAMVRPSDRLRENRRAVRELIAKSGVTNPRVFGSVARGEDTPESDLDILVTLGPGGLWEMVALPRELGELLGIHVDVVPDSGLQPKHVQILAEARPL